MNTNSNAPEVHALSDDGDHEIVEGADAANDIDQGQSPGSRLVTETLSRHKSTVSPPDAGRATAKPGFVLDFNLAPPAPVASRFQRGLQGRSAHEAKRPAVQGLGTRLDDSMKELSPSTSTSYSSFINANGTYPLASTHQPYANGSYDSVHTQAQHEEFAMHGEEEVGDDTTQYQQEPEDVYPTSPIVRPESRKLQARCAPSSGSGAGTTMVPSTNRSLSADILPRNIECRVRKSPQIGSPAHSTVRRQMAQVALEHPQRASARPSEEDLLLLLMRRQRLRTETHTRTLNSHDQLREDYAQLQRDNNACQQKLQEATAGWHTSMRTQHVQEAELKSFGEKYSKLKRWAEETRTLYDGLQADREILNEKVHAVKSDGIQNANEKREFLQKTANALQTVGTMKAAISELRLEAVKLEGVETQLAQERGRLRDEKLKNKSHALYIERLEASQRSLNSCFSKKQDEMGQQLAKIMRSVDNKDDTALTSSLAQIIDAIEQLRQQNFANEDNNQTLQTALASVGIHFDTLKASLEGLKNGQVDQHAASNLQLASLIDAVDKIKPDLERLQSLEQDSMALGSQLKRAESASKASEHDKNAIQLFCTGLLQAHKQLLDVRAASNQEAENAKIKQMEDTSKELHLKLNSSRSETSSLKTELENVRESLRETTTLLDAQEHHQEEQIEQARQEAWSRAAEQLNDMKAQLQAKNEDIGSKQEQVANLKGDIQKLRQEAARLNSQKEKLGEDAESLRVQLNQNESRTQGLAEERNTSLQRVGSLEQVESELAISKQKCSNLELAQQEYHKIQAAKADAEQRADKAQAHSQELEEKLRIAQEELQVSKKDCAALESSQRDRDQLHADNADLVKSLKETRVHGAQQGQQLQNVNHQLETLRGKCKELVFTKKKLEQRETDNATLKQTLNDAQAHSDQQQKQLNEANCQLKTLQGVSVDVKTLRQETASQEKQIDDLSSKCEDLKSQASRVPGLQQQVNEAAVRNNDLQNALATAEKAAGQVPNLQAQLEDYATRQDQLNKTQAELKDKTNVINVLQQRVQALESMESALKTATEESQAKDVGNGKDARRNQCS